MTYREKAAMEYSTRIGPDFIGGVDGCPGDYPYCYSNDILGGTCHNFSDDKCTACWDKETPGTEEKEESAMPVNTKKTKTQLVEEINELKKELETLENYKKYEEMANEFAAVKKAFVNAGFSDAEAMSILFKTMDFAIKMM